MTLKQIEYFQMVCEKENISAAADALFISRSVVSRAIADLEETFGAPIFVRSKNGVVLTESGKIIARLFDTFTNSYSAAKERIIRLQENEQFRILRIGATPTNIYCVYNTYIKKFRNRFPDIHIELEEHSAFEAWKLLLNDTLDAFFTPAYPDSSVFEMLDLYKNPIMLGTATNDPIAQKSTISIADMLDIPLAFHNAPMPIESILNTCFEALGKQPNIALRTSNLLLLKELTLQHKIYPLLPLDMMADWDNIQHVPLDFMHPSINRLIWSRILPCKKEMEILLDFMRNQNDPLSK